MKTSNKIFYVGVLAAVVAVFALIYIARHDAKNMGSTNHLLGLISDTDGSDVVVGNRNLISQEYKLPAFNRVTAGGKLQIVITQGEESKVAIETDQNVLPHFQVTVTAGELKLKSKSGFNLQPSQPIYGNIVTNELRSIVLGGESTFKATGLNSDELDINLGGKNSGELSGKVKQLNVQLDGQSLLHTDVTADVIRLTIGGKGTVTLSGKTNKLYISSGGTAIINAKDLIANVVTITGAGKLNATVQADKRLTVTSFGEAIIHYIGSPVIKKNSIGNVELIPQK